jgi:CO/xanthine dehydrogenase FAD-binding subunit
MVKSFRPTTLSEALSIRKNNDVMVYCGGSDVMIKYRGWSGTPAQFPKDILYIGHLEELKSLDVNSSSISIGAAVSYAQFLHDKRIPIEYKRPIEQIGSVAIRNIGTFAGNICNASPAADTLPILYALNAKVVIMSTDGTKEVSIEKFVTGPGSTCLKNDEIVSYIIIPNKTFSHNYYCKVGTRKANAISKVSVFAVADVVEHRVIDVRIAIGSCGPTVIRLKDAEAKIIGSKLSDLEWMIQELLMLYDDKIVPIDDVRSTKVYRSKVALNLIETFLVKELKQ